jgi:hypothetical protein
MKNENGLDKVNQNDARIIEGQNMFDENKKEDWQKISAKKDWSVLFLFFIIFPLVAYFWFGFQNLNKFETADEHLWINDPSEGRIHRYWNAMAQKDWKRTRINDKPGVSLAYVSGLGMLWQKDPRATVAGKENTSITYVPEEINKLYFNFRAPLFIFNGLMALVFLLLIWKTTKNKLLAFLTPALILLCPTLIGISQIVNPDSLLWSFSFAAILAFFFFLKSGKFIGGFLAAFFLGMALLSKYVSLILIPFFLLMALVYLFFEFLTLEKEDLIKKRLRQVFIGYPLIVFAGFGLFALLMPALIVKQGLLYNSTFGFNSFGVILKYFLILDGIFLVDALIFRGFITRWLMKKLQILKEVFSRLLYLFLAALFLVTVYNWSVGNNFLQLTDDIAKLPGIKTLWFNLIVVLRPVAFSLAPLVLVLVLFLWLKSIFKRSSFDYLVFSLSSFILIYIVALVNLDISRVVRYSIMLYPAILFLAAIGFSELLGLLRIKNKYLVALATIIILVVFARDSYEIRPYYFNYSSPLLPKNDTVVYGWGYGGYEAMQYINSQYNRPQDGKIWSDYYGVCPFFAGKCIIEGNIKWLNRKSLDSIDFYVTSTKGSVKNKSGWNKALKSGNVSPEPVWELQIGNRPANFIRVYRNINREQLW